MVFHPGKIVEVFKPGDSGVESADDSTQALVEMWDNNLLTLLVEPEIAGKLKTGDTVLVDYRVNNEKAPVPRQIITKILSGAKAKRIWDKYTAFFKKRKETSSARPGYY